MRRAARVLVTITGASTTRALSVLVESVLVVSVESLGVAFDTVRCGFQVAYTRPQLVKSW